MKTGLKYLALLALVIAGLTWPLLKVTSTEEDEAPDEREDVSARDAYRRMQLQDENGEIPQDALLDAYNQKESMPFLPEAWHEFMPPNTPISPVGTLGDPGALAETDPGVLMSKGDPDVPGPNPWVSIGPGNIGGRIRSIIVHPNISADTLPTIWIGAVSGGVWKTTDGGATWKTNTDFLANIGVHCMAIDPANPNILYAGTGETFRGNGIFKTTDGGDHWTRLNSTVPSEAHPDFYRVNRLAVCPTNSQLLLAATSADAYTGKIYRSTDAGGTWSLAQFPPASLVNIYDVRFQPHLSGPADTDIPTTNCIAGTGGNGAYYSNNGGATWTAATGLPSASGRVELAYSRSNPAIVYASVESGNGQLYRSTDAGHSFTRSSPTNFGGTTAGTYTHVLWVDPINSDRVIAGGAYMSRTTDRGATWEEASSVSTHLDHHIVVEDPHYNGVTNKTVYGSNDGGIYRTDDILQPCPGGNCLTWVTLNHNLTITQFYGAAGHAVSGKIVGGTQDNGTLVSPPTGSTNWTMMQGALGGDGGFCAVDQTNNPYFYGEFFFLQIYRSINAGQSKEYIWDDPQHGIPKQCPPPPAEPTHPCASAPSAFVMDPNEITGNTLLAGGSSLWRSRDARNLSAKPSWTQIKEPVGALDNESRYISAIAVAPGDSNIIWVGLNDGTVYYTTNGNAGSTPAPTAGTDDLPPELPLWHQVSGLPTGRMCTRIAIGKPPQPQPTDPDVVGRKVYVTFGSFYPNSSDSRGNVWKTQGYGGMWTEIRAGLPSAPMYSIVISPINPNTLYLGTEVGVFASADDGVTWSPGNGGPANVPVFDLFWMGPKLVAVTHGRSIFTLQRFTDD
jgi:photosystem II stability/assembly factor-like uncharacterized protein